MQLIISMIICAAGILSSIPLTHAATQTMATCDQTGFDTAYTAASNGDTIAFPAGVCNISGFSKTIAKEITIQGNTSGCPSACIDTTTLSGASGILIQANNVVVTGITFVGSGGSVGGSGSAGIGIYRSSGDDRDYTNWRIHHNHFNGWTNIGIIVGNYGPPPENQRKFFPGLIDNNRFTTTTGRKALEAYGATGDHSSWGDTVALGGSDFLFVENNTYVSTCITDGLASIDSDSGARVVIRNNTFTNGWITGHGPEYGGDPRTHPGTHAFEVYGNAFDGTGAKCSDGSPYWIRMNYRGGTGVVYSNTFSTGVDIPGIFQYYRGNVSGYCDTAVGCDGDYAADGNTAGTNGWVCYAQPGATGALGVTSAPIYEWGNTWGGTACNDSTTVCFDRGYNQCSYDHVKTGRDLILNTAKSGYQPYTYPHPLQTERRPATGATMTGGTMR